MKELDLDKIEDVNTFFKWCDDFVALINEAKAKPESLSGVSFVYLEPTSDHPERQVAMSLCFKTDLKVKFPAGSRVQ